MNELNEREEGIFNEARNYSDSEKRSAYLEIACHGDRALQQRIERLLNASAQATNFFGQPAADDLGESLTEVGLPLTEGPGSVIGRYKILQQIGEGGMGAVFMAEQTEPIRRKVALKIIKLGMDTRQVVARFEAERQALAMMDHPHIARVLDAGATDSGRPYFVMELVAGVPITEYCDKNKLSSLERLQLFMPVCHAIQHAHQKGVIHRDIKPANVMITLHDGHPVPKVIDFGIAKATNQRLTEKTLFTNYAQMIGTPAYMSPEQAEMSGLDVDTRTDVYSLGVLLYELLTGTTPFPAKELMSMGYGEMQKVISEKEPPKPSTRMSTMQHEPRTVVARNRSMEAADVGKAFKGDLDWIVMKALEKDRTHRYETVNGLVADVERHINDEPVTAAAPTFAYQFQKFYRRNRGYLRAAALVAGLLVLLTVFSFYQAARATRQKDLAREEKQRADEAVESERNARVIADSQKSQADKEKGKAQLQRYVSDMRLAQAKLADENLGLVRELLDQHRPIPEGDDFRGWEWRWLWQESRGNALFRLSQGSGKINSLSASHDGKWLAFMVFSRGFQIWDVSRREQVLIDTAKLQILGVQFSPTQPELAILCGDRESMAGLEIQIWKTSTMTFDRRWPLPPGRRLISIKYSGDGQYLVGKSGRGLPIDGRGLPIDVWETATGTVRPSQTIGLERDSNVDWAVNSDASRIAQGDDGFIVVSDLISGKELWRKQATDDTVISALAFSPDDATLASGHGFADGVIRTWDAGTGNPKDKLEGHLRVVHDLQFSPDGKTLYSASGDQTVRVWDLNSGEQLGILRGQSSHVRRIALLPKTGRIAGAGKRNGVNIWDLESGGKDIRETNRPDEVRGYGFHESSERVWMVNSRGEVRERDTRTLKAIGLSRDLHQTVELAAFSDHGDLLATRSKDGLTVWDLQSEKDAQPIPLSEGVLTPMGFVDQDRSLVFMQVFDRDHQRIVEWDLTKNEKKRSWPVSTNNRRSRKNSYLFIDGGAAMFGTHAGGFQHIDLVTGVAAPMPHLKTMLDRPSNVYGDLSFSSDQRHMALSSDQMVLHLSSDTKFRTGAIRKETIEGFSQGAHGVAFSPNTKRLALGSVGREAIKLWHLDAQEHTLTLQGKGSVFYNLSYSPDGNCIAATNANGLFHLWRAPSRKEIEEAEAKEEKETFRQKRKTTPSDL